MTAARAFDPGYAQPPFGDLVARAPGPSVYPPDAFRVEWGPVFHRGRLDGSARVLVLGQDPAQHETVLRRILVGEAGHRTQGFLHKLGIDCSYVMVNTFLYSVYGQGGGSKHRKDTRIAAYRNQWLAALLAPGKVEAVVALGFLADLAWQDFRATSAGESFSGGYQHITHPTQPESAGGSSTEHAAAIAALLANWNSALDALHPLKHPDKHRRLRHYGDAFATGDKRPIPAADAPPWAPDWMLTDDGWASRTGSTAEAKRATITIRVPTGTMTGLLES